MKGLAAKLPNLMALWDSKTKIRDQLNKDTKAFGILGSSRWQLVNGGLDAIDDANTALWTYFDMIWPSGTGSQLLNIYGYFQASIIQQDGVFELLAAANKTDFKKELKKATATFSILNQNRELRDRLVGHPANKNRRTENPTAGTFNRHAPDRIQITAAVFSINTGSFQSVKINTLDFTEKQAGALNLLLQPIIPWAANPV